MHKLILLAFVLAAGIMTYATESSAAVCAKGINRAGCIGPRGAVVGSRAMYPRGATVIRGTTVNPRRGTVVHRRTVIR